MSMPSGNSRRGRAELGERSLLLAAASDGQGIDVLQHGMPSPWGKSFHLAELAEEPFILGSLPAGDGLASEQLVR